MNLRSLPFRAPCTLVLAIATSVTLLPNGASMAASVRPGSACSARLVGQQIELPSQMLCTRMTLRATRRTAYKWLPIDPGATAPTPEVIRRFGGIAPTTPADPSAATTTAPAPIAPSSATANCLEGTWQIDGATLNRYLEQASGVPGNFVDSTTMRITFRGGQATGEGAIQMRPDPTGMVSGSASILTTARYTTDGRTLTFPDTSTFIAFDVRVAGQRVDVPEFRAPGGMTLPYTCSRSEFSYTVTIPGGRTASATWRRM